MKWSVTLVTIKASSLLPVWRDSGYVYANNTSGITYVHQNVMQTRSNGWEKKSTQGAAWHKHTLLTEFRLFH